MVNNSMYLIHLPTLVGVLIGEQTKTGWQTAPDQSLLGQLYKWVALNHSEEADDYIVEQTHNGANEGYYPTAVLEEVEGLYRFSEPASDIDEERIGKYLLAERDAGEPTH